MNLFMYEFVWVNVSAIVCLDSINIFLHAFMYQSYNCKNVLHLTRLTIRWMYVYAYSGTAVYT